MYVLNKHPRALPPWLAFLGTKQGRYRFLIIALLSLSLITGTTLLARYVYGRQQSALITAPQFYFESDTLTTTGKTYYLNPNVTELTFSLQNFADELRQSDDDIHYTVTVESTTAPASPALLSPASGTLTGKAQQQVEVTLSNLQSGHTYVVTARGDAGFVQILRATFTVLPKEPALYQYTDAGNEAYVLLTVWTENLSGNVTVDFPEGLIPDNSWPDMAGILTSAGEFTQSFATDSSRVYRFIKTEAYTGQAFAVTCGSITATEKIPE